MNFSMQAAKEMTKKMINEDFVDVYDKYFTQSEINDYIAFYKSPSGRKFIRVTPLMTKDVMMIIMQKYMPDFQKKIDAKMQEMKNPVKDPTSISENEVLILLGNKKISKSEMEKLNANDIESIDVIKDKENVKRYTSEDYSGVVIIHMKNKN